MQPIDYIRTAYNLGEGKKKCVVKGIADGLAGLYGIKKGTARVSLSYAYWLVWHSEDSAHFQGICGG